MSEADALAADLTGKIDYIQMGYNDAAGAAGGMIETIREFANITPFRFAELQESALRMRAFGFELQEVLNKNKETGEFEGGIVAVGNAVSALGGGADAFRRITYALGQMKQAGRVYQNDMMQLANAGIGGYRYIARSLMKEITTDGSGSASKVKAGQEKLFNQLEANAIETVRRLTTNGQISGEAAARAILNGLEEDFGGGMEAQAKTFVGAFSTVADTSQSLVADAFTPLYKIYYNTDKTLYMIASVSDSSNQSILQYHLVKNQDVQVQGRFVLPYAFDELYIGDGCIDNSGQLFFLISQSQKFKSKNASDFFHYVMAFNPYTLNFQSQLINN
jgi:tape measure domain-containing protein